MKDWELRWASKRTKWESSPEEIDYFQEQLKRHGKKTARYFIFAGLKGRRWCCRDCCSDAMQAEGVSTTQYAGSGGIKGLKEGSAVLPAMELERSRKQQCKIHGNKHHDKWTGYFMPRFTSKSIPLRLQKKIFEIYNYYDSIELRQRKEEHLMIDHKFPRAEFGVSDEIDSKTILEKLLSGDLKKKRDGESDCKKYFQVLKKRQGENHNKLKTEFCGKCTTCPACEKEFKSHSENQIQLCAKKKAKNPAKGYGKRGIVMGINFYYEGTAGWPNGVPRRGLEAEKGCVGCGWYDTAKWREELNKKLMGP